jgi:hypothetical protein
LYWFEYGAALSYGSSTVRRSLPSRARAYYLESWDTGFGGWDSWMKRDHCVGGERKDCFMRLSEPSPIDDNHDDGIGSLHLLHYFFPGTFTTPECAAAFLGGGRPDLRGAKISIRLRGQDWQPKGSELLFWAQYHKNIELLNEPGWRRANWAYTGCVLTDYLLDGQWHQADYTLVNDSRKWTYGGNNPTGQGNRAERYQYAPLNSVLSDLNWNFFHMLAFVDPMNPPTGSIDLDDFVLSYPNKSLLVPDNGGELIEGPSEGLFDAATLTDGWRNGQGHVWQSARNPLHPLEFTYAFKSLVRIHTIQLHQNPDWPARDVEVLVSEGGREYRTVLSRTLPRRGVPNSNFAFTVDTGLSAAARYLKLRILSGYESTYWGLGGIEVFGSGATMLPDENLNYVNEDIGDLIPGRVYHYRVVVADEQGTYPGEDVTFTVPAADHPIAQISRASRIRASGATLEGRINAMGLPTHYYFEYGRDTAFENRSPRTYGGLQVTPRTVFVSLSDLEHAIPYRYRLVAENSSGITRSATGSFVTST